MLAAVSLNLSSGEQVIFEGHPSWRAILGFYLKGIVVAVVLGVIAKLVSGNGTANGTDPQGTGSNANLAGWSIAEVLANFPKQVEQYRAGKTAVMGFLVGAAMKASRGQANPNTVGDLLKAKLS